MLQAVSSVILKPTKACNAACTYCAAPAEASGAARWTLDQFKRYFDELLPYLADGCNFIWHGGEPMLMGPEFYRAAHAYVGAALPGARFSMQTNLLGYDSERWGGVLRDVFKGAVSTSYDPDERDRVFKGSPELYARMFRKKLETAVADGFRPLVIGTFSEETVGLAHRLYDMAAGFGAAAPSIRLNYRYPLGRAVESGPMISPRAYGEMLLEIWDRWIREVPPFDVTPLDQMLGKVLGTESGRCPWTSRCGGRMLGIEPDGSVWNCVDFADLGDPAWCFGNIGTDSMAQMLASPAAVACRRRRVAMPQECRACPHFAECEGGCMRDALLYGGRIDGKFYYCESWTMCFARIKQSVASGEAAAMVARARSKAAARDGGQA